MHYQKLETEKYLIAATQTKVDKIHNRQAIQAFQTFLFGVLTIGAVLYLSDQYPTWLPDLVNFLEAQSLKWI